ncbi:MAG: glycosyltransferase [Gammaproteobacteria bacterium]|nr:glycosyltransferase [Gammaproteobacteria bacterium]
MSEKPRVSVIIPVFRVEPFIRECLDSVVNQTMMDPEIICVYTSSSDRSEEIVREYAARDPRFKVINKEDGGLPEARNVGLTHASGEYIAFLDSDDYLETTCCERLYAVAKEQDADMTMFYFQCFGDIDKDSPPRDINRLTTITEPLQKLETTFANWQTAWCSLYRHQFIRDQNLRFHYGLIFEDLPGKPTIFGPATTLGFPRSC